MPGALELTGVLAVGCASPPWYTSGKFMFESVAFYQGCANIRFMSVGSAVCLGLGIFDQDSMTRPRVQKTDQPGQSLPRVLIDNRYATRLGRL
jgi:hypothetical protein